MEVANLSLGSQFVNEDLACVSAITNTAAMASPILVFLFFHKAIRSELVLLRMDSLAVEKGEATECQSLFCRCEFLRVVYTQHSNAEDEVIFPALDSRVKNIAQTYSLEHEEVSYLFDQMLERLISAVKEGSNASTTLRRDIFCYAEAIQTTLCKHMAKEEEQVFPLLMQHLSHEEQSGLVWQFICSIPVNLMENFLPWLASRLPKEERHEMIACVNSAIPKNDLLRQVVFTWLKGPSMDANGVEVKNITHELNGALRTGENGCLLGQSISEEANLLSESKSLGLGQVPCESDAHGLPAETSIINVGSCEKRSSSPIDVLLFWHKAIRKELAKFAQDAKQIQLSYAKNLQKFSKHLQFLAEVCIFHSAAEDKVLFPAIGRKSKQRISFEHEHTQEGQQFDYIRGLLKGIQNELGLTDSTEISSQLCGSAELLLQTIEKHLVEEEMKVFPLARAYCSTEEQQILVYQCLRVMPLKLLERVLPWLVASLGEEEVKIMLDHVRLAAPAADTALITLLLGWACRGQFQNPVMPSHYSCFCSEITPSSFRHQTSCCWNTQCSLNCEISHCSSSLEKERTPPDGRPLKRPKGANTINDQEVISSEDVETEDCHTRNKCCVPGLGVGGSSSLGFGAGTGRRSLQPLPSNPLQSFHLGSGSLGLGSEPRSPSSGIVPIDTIFQFHKAIRKDLKYLDDESATLLNCDDGILRRFAGRFQLLWSLYRAHSSAEDRIVFPALEAKEALHNVSHSYTIDHKHEEQLFQGLNTTLFELSALHARLCGSDHKGSDGKPAGVDDCSFDNLVLHQRNLVAKLQGMCRSVHVTLDQHVTREERELWPLFSLHFTVDEQEKIVGQIIGTTGAEVLQAMLPWVTTALSQEEQNTMMYTWCKATRNTMFEKWLRAWWKRSPSGSFQSSASEEDIPESGTPESLQLVADYLSRNRTELIHSVEEKLSDCKTCSKEPFKQMAAQSLGSDSQGDVWEDSEHEPFSCGEGHSDGKKVKNTGSEQGFEGKIDESTAKFKPGWQDIFRMNEKELEAAVRKVSGDTSLDPRRKAYLMQNLMTSRWIVAQQHPLRTLLASSSGEQKDIPGRCPSYINANEEVFGCEHYKRNCKIRAACCGTLFPCRLCHDKVSDHTMDRQATQEMMCMKCLDVQPVAQYCATPSCHKFCMAKYFCNICKLFDDERDIYHCPSCNLCRVGKGLGLDVFHCMTCNACMSMSLTSHKCRENGLESNCPICHDFLFTSHTPVKALRCGHFMHSACYKAYTFSHYTCPICSRSLGDMNIYFGMLDALLALEELPEEYRDRQQDILCHDCEAKGRAPFHWLYHKCRNCGSYNTRAI